MMTDERINDKQPKKAESQKEPKLHDGHRERLRERFASSLSFDSFSEHEIIELLLFYVIPRVNTNELAHRLIRKYGSFTGVLNAPFEELCSFSGLGRQSALYLKMLMRLCSEYERSVQKDIDIYDAQAVVSYVKYQFSGETEECGKLFCVNSKGKLTAPRNVGRGDGSSVSLNLKLILTTVLNSDCSIVILAHNHPNGNITPSGEDVQVTRMLYQTLNMLGIELLDHIIVSGNKASSMRRLGFLEM